MSSATMETAAQRYQAPNSSSPYSANAGNRQYASQSTQNRESYYKNQGPPPNSNQSSRRLGGHHGHSSSMSSPPLQPQYYKAVTGSPPVMDSARSHLTSPETPPSTNHSRNKSLNDQYDGAPVPPPRVSSQHQQQQQQPTSSTAQQDPRSSGRQARHPIEESRSYSNRDRGQSAEYDDPARDRTRDNTTAAAAAAARNRRKGPGSPEPDRHGAGSRERQQQALAAATTAHSRSEARTPLLRENSEVINRVVVSDPQVDIEREQERVAESRPAPIGTDVTPVTGLGLVGSEGVEDGGRGGAKRQDYSKSASRRKEVQFGEYMLGQTLGEGEFGKVKLGWKKDGTMQVAIKLIRRETVATNPSRLPKIYREISILRGLTHPNIVRLHEMVETDRHIGIILEYASGGELFDYILNHRYLKDHAARRLFAQLVSGVGYLHKKGIVHRDLKLENLLLDRNRNIIITDFGFANTFNAEDELTDEIEYNLNNREFVKKFKLDRLDDRGMRKGDLMQTSCGSPCYAAPELVVSDSLYTGRKVDVWSCGVILYAMLAGYLPFDDDPANPEGDNINLLYKYITSTPLTFPEYVTPHARDLLRRILVPDPRKRADLFEVARHSWLSEYHHVVSHITSSTTNIADIADSTVPPDEPQASPPHLARSASVREPGKPPTSASPVGGLTHQQGSLAQDEDTESSRGKRDKAARHTLQPEWVPPQSHTARGESSAPAKGSFTEKQAAGGSQGQLIAATQAASRTKPLPEDPPVGSEIVTDYPGTTAVQQKMPPPARPAREVPRSVSDSNAAFTASAMPQTQIARPSTGGSMTSGSGGRSEARYPSRGSYSQPAAPTVAATNAQGRVTQPKNSRGYNISGPVPQQNPQSSMGHLSTQVPAENNETPTDPQQATKKPHHRRSSTLSELSVKLFGRSPSFTRKQQAEAPPRQKTNRKYPPTSMKEPFPADNPPASRRTSGESRRSFSFTMLGKKRSSDLESTGEKPSRRFSLRSLLGGRNKDRPSEADSPAAQAGEFSSPPDSRGQTEAVSGQNQAPDFGTESSVPLGSDGQQDQEQTGKTSTTILRSQPQSQQPPPESTENYGGTGLPTPTSQFGDRSYLVNQTTPVDSYRTSTQTGPNYPEGFTYDEGRPSMQQGRTEKKHTTLQKSNRKFTDAFEHEHGPTHHEGSSGAAKKVMDFFRRRGRARVDDYRLT